MAENQPFGNRLTPTRTQREKGERERERKREREKVSTMWSLRKDDCKILTSQEVASKQPHSLIIILPLLLLNLLQVPL